MYCEKTAKYNALKLKKSQKALTVDNKNIKAIGKNYDETDWYDE